MKAANKVMHLVAIDVPYPPDYGGAIDTYYKLKALHEAGYLIHLHCFEYQQRRANAFIESVCFKVYYYERSFAWWHHLGWRPFIVTSRAIKALKSNLQRIEAPILFEGLHTTAYLNDVSLSSRKKIVRMHNIEHHYYWGLAKAERRLLKKLFLATEAIRLYFYQRQLKKSSAIAAISEADEKYLKKRFSNVDLVPPFHAHVGVPALTPRGDFALYHGNLGVSENAYAASFLTSSVFDDLGIQLVVAGNNPPRWLEDQITKNKNVKLIKNTTTEQISQLVAAAHVNVLPTFQATGVKLKLLAALHLGRFCIVNAAMVQGTGLHDTCAIADGPASFKQQVKHLYKQSWTMSDAERRKVALKKYEVKQTLLKLEQLLNS